MVTTKLWPSLAPKEGEKVMVDTDGDGMPDDYEDANGFDKNNEADGAEIADNGYSNLENYLNKVIETSAVSRITAADASVSSVSYYTLSGARIAQPQQGVTLRVERLSNGQTNTSKVLVR